MSHWRKIIRRAPRPDIDGFRGSAGGLGSRTTEATRLFDLSSCCPTMSSIFLKLSLLSSSQAFARMTGIRGTRRECRRSIVANSPFPLPPLAEQHRIVAKVDELMALCDRLEAAQAERERRRDRLAAASLDWLNAPDVVPTFRRGR